VPAGVGGLGQQPAFAEHACVGLNVVTEAVGRTQMVRGRHHIGCENHRPPIGVLKHDRLLAPCVARDEKNEQARGDLGPPISHRRSRQVVAMGALVVRERDRALDLAQARSVAIKRDVERQKMIAVVRPRHHRVVCDRIVPFLLLREDLGVGEREADLVLIARCFALSSNPVGCFAGTRSTGQPARVVEVEVADNRKVDVCGVNAGVLDGVFNGPAVETEDVAHLGVELVAGSCFDEDGPPAAAEQESVVAEFDSVAFVGLDRARPDGAWDDAEHAAAVEQELAGAEEGPVVLHFVGHVKRVVSWSADVARGEQAVLMPIEIARMEEARQARAMTEISLGFEHIMGGVMSYMEPGSWANQACGVGLNGPIEEADVDRLVEYFVSKGVEPKVEICQFADSSILRALAKRNFELREFEAVLAKQILPDERMEDLLTHGWPVDDEGERLVIECVDPQDDAMVLESWRVAMSGFVPEVREPSAGELDMHRKIVGHPHGEFVVAKFGDTVVGAGGAEYPRGDDITVMVLFGVSVLEPWRKRGVQQALIAHRVEQGRQRGAQVATIHSLPGASTDRNAMRLGFAPSYTKTIMAMSGEGLVPSP
jgi:GNAT superfamily N-acetyltransferase